MYMLPKLRVITFFYYALFGVEFYKCTCNYTGVRVPTRKKSVITRTGTNIYAYLLVFRTNLDKKRNKFTGSVILMFKKMKRYILYIII